MNIVYGPVTDRYYMLSHCSILIRYNFLAGHFHRLLDGLLCRMWLVDNDTVFAGNRSLVHGTWSSIQRWDGSSNAVFAGQPSPTGVDGADAVVRLEHHRASSSNRKRWQIINNNELLYKICYSNRLFRIYVYHFIKMTIFLPSQLLSTSVFKNGGYRWLYNWKGVSQSTYWSTSSREFGCLLQIVPLLIVPFAGIVQTCRYLATGPPDLFDVSARYIFITYKL